MITRIVQRENGYWYAEVWNWFEGWEAVRTNIKNPMYAKESNSSIRTWSNWRNKEQRCSHSSYDEAKESLCYYKSLINKKPPEKVRLKKYFWTNNQLEKECDCENS